MSINVQLLEFSRQLRSNCTDAENFMWQLLRAKRFMNLEPYRVCRRLSILRECSDDQIKIYP
ncbi:MULTISPECIES: DUF559 domain-containing protein [unclassified Acinetobacter]|uniref:DUF559 domain-containing protein n=1 Tax=unclassified Acinetobacter TaxID=196816 RepID=UPI0015D17E0D